ncbi:MULTISPECIES: adenylate/guanylate cyclase domain-containing protein [unclassified Nostoc]|uniref:adenylate/guanylate cyclase domain-containing protein n=1 Tax=unclassified Nostoc TaxID=2593658 RepID=UPI0025AB0226|nr:MULTISPECIES: adenylate/guanylate cyclase domain-containing protein [unclassified Nostoc]MDM9583481.1 adenylate/guanylate cyclase domain-containing protein [Nostoc sp. GT001]MDZ7947324.1 adenylate/guanylate cyclase domain-containing protein [Nostoc sp. EfeVER01]MDZ7994604.1 adenylate/guanylate cyclase domain-containing protein [Nostoc sp. EspVER01]
MEQVITSMADALLVTSNSGKIKKVNRAAQQLFGFREEELINQPISLIIDDNQILTKAISQHSYLKRSSQNLQVVCRTKTREKLLIAFSCSVIAKKTEGLEDIVYIGRDITAWQRREQRTSAQYAITRILSESQSVRQVIPQILQSICQNLGWDLGELWTPSQYIGTSLQGDSLNAVLRCVEIWSSRLISAREFKAITWQATYTPGVGLPGKIWIRRLPLWIKDITVDGDNRRSQPAAEAGLHAAFGFPILDDSEILGVMVFFSRDVQPKDKDLLQMMGSIGSQISQFIKRKQAENALVESEERYRDLFENANDLIQCVNPSGRFLYVNRAWRETLGYSEAEIANMSVFDIIHPEFKQHCLQRFYRVLSGEKLGQVTATFVTKDGQTIFLEGNINCKFVEGHPTAIRGIFRNVTQRLAAEEALRHQQEETERLLLNILPAAISKELKEQPASIAEDFADVTVLFADIVGLSEIATSISAIQLLNLLNSIFSAFDRLTERYSLERIKNINDAYMVVGGLPTRRQDHAQAIALMALDMQTAIALFNTEKNQNFSIRIGIHSGSIMGGVIELNKFTYELYKDTVNIARSMESQDVAGKIQVTENTYKCLCDEFVFEKRGEIEVKDKGKITTYLLIGKKE